MPDTGRRLGLTINRETDDRLDIPKSTRAAARYLRDLHVQFGDWTLALAAYDAGEIVVRNAVLRSGGRDFGLGRIIHRKSEFFDVEKFGGCTRGCSSLQCDSQRRQAGGMDRERSSQADNF